MYGEINDEKILDQTAEISTWCRKFCPPKIMSAEILSNKLTYNYLLLGLTFGGSIGRVRVVGRRFVEHVVEFARMIVER